MPFKLQVKFQLKQMQQKHKKYLDFWVKTLHEKQDEMETSGF